MIIICNNDKLFFPLLNKTVMMNKNDTVMLSPALQQQRLAWLTAYKNQNTNDMGVIESKDFFVVFYQNVEKKQVWHDNVINSQQENDPLLALIQSDKNIKVRYDCISPMNYIITSFIKEDSQTTLIKEMWEEQNQIWQISSLVINLTPAKPI